MPIICKQRSERPQELQSRIRSGLKRWKLAALFNSSFWVGKTLFKGNLPASLRASTSYLREQPCVMYVKISFSLAKVPVLLVAAYTRSLVYSRALSSPILPLLTDSFLPITFHRAKAVNQWWAGSISIQFHKMLMHDYVFKCHVRVCSHGPFLACIRSTLRL